MNQSRLHNNKAGSKSPTCTRFNRNLPHLFAQQAKYTGCVESCFRAWLPEDGGVTGKPVMEAGGHRHAHGPGSIEEKVVAADVVGVVAGEEEHGVGDV